MKDPHQVQIAYSTRTKVASFKANAELWSRFKETCKLRGVSICHVLEALMEAWIQAQKVEATLLKPVHIDLKMEHVVQRPRRMKDAWRPEKMVWPPSCEDADEFIKSTKEVGCRQIKDWIPLKECWRCFRLTRME